MPQQLAAASVLLIEDDAGLAELLERVLTGERYDVTVAGDGQRGVHLALTRRFDVLVVDRGLPAIEGLDLVARLRASGLETPALVLSARGTTQDRVDGLDAGAEDYLTKPFELAELLARLRALLRRHTDTAQVLTQGRTLSWCSLAFPRPPARGAAAGPEAVPGRPKHDDGKRVASPLTRRSCP